MAEQSTFLKDDGRRQLAEALARFLNCDAFNGRARSKHNAEVAFHARKIAMKNARAAIRFFAKPGNLERLQAMTEFVAQRNIDAEGLA